MCLYKSASCASQSCSAFTLLGKVSQQLISHHSQKLDLYYYNRLSATKYVLQKVSTGLFATVNLSFLLRNSDKFTKIMGFMRLEDVYDERRGRLHPNKQIIDDIGITTSWNSDQITVAGKFKPSFQIPEYALHLGRYASFPG
ncbi:hypothetical protein F0562_028271 [Nyssa sinensis]|uniref:Uncharacterized protein n=1 Tax=Nyssa sinensis TaxID=561372 RepID=A0A5J5B5Z8_9ASTE|nr:hypothetical protein F0562_028271 [Nyssa sinensis]